MKSKMILFFVSFVMLFSACRNEDEPTLPAYGSRTVLIYMMAQNSLSPFARLDMEEMIKGMKQVDATSNNLLVYIRLPVWFVWVKTVKGRLWKKWLPTIRNRTQRMWLL